MEGPGEHARLPARERDAQGRRIVGAATIASRAPAAVLAAALFAATVGAQERAPAPAPTPEPAWKGSIGGGLALTTGNSDTNSYNVSLAAAYDPKRKNSLKSEGRYLRSTTSDVRTVDKTALLVRDEYKLSDHSFVFAETRLFRDVLKGIRYLVSPLAGAGVKLVDRERAQLLLDGAVGGQFEKDDGRPRNSSGAFQAGQQLTLKLSSNASLSQRAYALWKMGDFADPLLEKNDASVVAALVFKIG